MPHDTPLPDRPTDSLRESGTWLALGESLSPRTLAEGVSTARAAWPTVPGYRILEELGRGGMGVVYLAVDENLRRRVALKMLPAADDAPDQHNRFKAEAAAIAQLRHPGIVQIYEVGEADGRPYFALEYLEGGTLRTWVGGKPQDSRVAAELVRTMADAVEYAHSQGIIHRDLKPANILLVNRDAERSASGGTSSRIIPKITDFGLAKIDPLRQESLGSGNGAPTKTGEVLGTPNYMAPEQASGKPNRIGPAVDVYSLGAILYELLTGHPPFDGPAPMEILLRVVNEEPLPPRRLQPKVPRDLETICLKCLEKEPARRYNSAAALGADLGRFLAGEPIHARPTPVWERGWKWAKRRPALASLSGATLAIGLTLLVGGWYTSAVLNDALSKTKAAELQAKVSAERAKKLADEADAQRQLALRAFQQVIYDIQMRLKNTPANRELRTLLLQKATEGLDELARSTASSEPTAARLFAHTNLGDIYRRIGNAAEAARQYEAARLLAEQMLLADPNDEMAQLRMGEIEIERINRLLEKDQTDAALELAQKHERRTAAWLAADPTSLARMRTRLQGHEKLAHVLHWKHRFAEARPHFLAAHELAQRLLEAQPDLESAVYSVASTGNWVGKLLRDEGKLVECLPYIQRTYAISKELLKKHPKNPSYLLGLLAAQDELALIAEEVGNSAEARRLLRELPALLEDLVAEDPENANDRLYLVDAYCALGQFELRHLEFDAAISALDKSKAVLDDLKQRGKLSGNRLYELERPDQINERRRYALAVKQLLADPDASPPSDWQFYAADLWSGVFRWQLLHGDLRAAMAALKRIEAAPEASPADQYRKSQAYAMCLFLPTARRPAVSQLLESGNARDLVADLTCRSLELLKRCLDTGWLPPDNLREHAGYSVLWNKPEFKELCRRQEELRAAKQTTSSPSPPKP